MPIFVSQIDALFKRIEICMNEKEKDKEEKTDEGLEEVEKEVEVNGRGPLKVGIDMNLLLAF